MTVEQLQWLIGVSVTAVIAIAGIVISLFVGLGRRISTATGELHKRVDRIRDEYTRRDDLGEHLKRIDATLKEVRDDQKKLYEQVVGGVIRGTRGRTK